MLLSLPVCILWILGWGMLEGLKKWVDSEKEICTGGRLYGR